MLSFSLEPFKRIGKGLLAWVNFISAFPSHSMAIELFWYEFGIFRGS